MAASKRIQVMLRPEVYEIVKELAEEDNLSDSKTISILVEQALVERSLWDSRTRQRMPKEVTDDPHFKSVNRTDILADLPEGVQVETVMTKNTNQQPQSEPTIELDDELLALAKKLKALKALELI